MKRFIKRMDLTSLWEEDGDLKRMKAFFHAVRIQSDSEENEQIKQSIKQKALEKMAQEERVGLPLIGKEGLVQRIRTKLRSIFGQRQWKLGISVVGLAMLVIIGQGVMNGSFNLLPRIGSTEKSSQAQQAPSTSSVGGSGSYGGETPNGSMAARDIPAPQSAYSKGTSDSSAKSANQTPPSPPDLGVVPPADAGIPRKITQDLTLTLEVAAINDSVTRISREVQQLGGYVVESQQNGSNSQSSAHLTLKIPAEKLNGLRDSLSTWGKILDQRTIANDITNQYYDSQVRLRTLETEEKRYLEILNQAKTVEDVLKVENALGNIRQQIEQLKGKLKLWNNLVDYSTVNLQLVTLQSPNLNVKNPWQPISWGKTWKATQDAVLKTISSTWNVINYLVVGVGYALPYLIIGAMGWVAYRVWKKRNI